MKKLFLVITLIMIPVIIWWGLDAYKKRNANKQYMTAVSLFAEKKDLGKAIELIDQAIDLNPKENYSYLYKKAEIFHYSSKYDQALACLDELIKISPNCVDAYKFKAEILDEMDRREEAIAVYDEAFRNNPGNQDLIQYREEFLAKKKDIDLD